MNIAYATVSVAYFVYVLLSSYIMASLLTATFKLTSVPAGYALPSQMSWSSVMTLFNCLN